MLPSRYLVATIDSAENKRIGSGGKFLFSLDITFQLAKQTFIRYKQAFIRYKYVFIRYKQAFFGKPKNVTQYQQKFTSYRVWLLFFYLFIFSPGEHFASYKSNLNQHLTAGFSSTFSFFNKLIIRSLSFLKIHRPCSLKDDNG